MKPPPSKARKAATLLTALLLAAGFLYAGAKVVLIGGTKASFSFVDIKSPPGGGPTPTTTKSTPTTTKSAATPSAPTGTGRR